MIIGSQVRGARAILRMTVAELAAAAHVAPNTIVRFEADRGVNTTTLTAIQRALEAAGIVFVPENGGGPGVRLGKKSADKSVE